MGCTGETGKERAQNQRTLKVMYWDEESFLQQYGDLFTVKYPNTNIEVVSNRSMYEDVMDSGNLDSGEEELDKRMLEFIEKEQPDIILLDTSNYELIASKGKLTELDSLIERDKYDVENISSGILDSLKELGGNKLYGLAPFFHGQAIYYNIDLFNKYGVEPPTDGMSWQEILDIAKRFPAEGSNEERIYGYAASFGLDMNSLVRQIAITEGLSTVNSITKKVTMNTESWKTVYKIARDAMTANSVYSTEEEGNQNSSTDEFYKSQPFLMGRVAITVNGPYLLENIKEVKQNYKNYKPFELGIVAGPVNPAEPDKSNNASLDEIFAIRANSPNMEAAWDFIKFINGDEYSKTKSRTVNSGLLSRSGATKEYNGYSLEAFYKIKPKVSSVNKSSNIPSDFSQPFQEIIDRETDLIKENKKSIEEAIITMQDEGQTLLDKAYEKISGNKK